MGDYLLTKELGSGTFSRVYEASILESNDPPVAIKVIHRDPGQPYFDKTALRRESYLWSKLSHPHLLRMFESFETDDAIFVVMELAKDGPLLDYVLKNGHPGLPEPLAKSFFSQIASALQYLHTTMGIVHRDVKLENILVDESTKTVKLADFGLSVPVSEHFWESYSDLMDAYDPPIGTSGKDKAQPGSPLPAAQPGRGTSSRAPIPGPGNHHHVRSQSTVHSRPLQSMTGTSSAIQISTSHNDPSTSSSVCAFTQGSLHYCAPETLQAQSQVSLSSDIWSLGCVLHALLTGSLPFNDSYLPRLQLSIVHGRWDPGRLERAGVSAEARELVTRMLNVNVAERLTINGVLSHPWLRRQ